MTVFEALCNDLEAEHAALDALVAPLDAETWRRPTPAEGWSILDSIVHLALTTRTRRALRPTRMALPLPARAVPVMMPSTSSNKPVRVARGSPRVMARESACACAGVANARSQEPRARGSARP